MKRFAFLISRIFEPEVMLFILMVDFVVVFQPPIPVIASWIVGFAVVVGFFLWELKSGRISDVDISKRTQRFPLLLLAGGVIVVLVAVLFFYQQTQLLGYFSVLLLWLISFGVITTIWKISGHTSAATIMMLDLIQIHGLITWPILLFLIPIAWARVYQKNHTVAQVIAGVVLSVVVSIVGFNMLTA